MRVILRNVSRRSSGAQTMVLWKRIIDVEIAPSLAEIAKSNLNKLAITNASVCCLDASDYTFPNEDFIIYLYKPFSGEVVQYVIDNLYSSRCRSILVIYNLPECAELFDRCGFLVRLGSPPGRDDVVVWTTPGRTPP